MAKAPTKSTRSTSAKNPAVKRGTAKSRAATATSGATRAAPKASSAELRSKIPPPPAKPATSLRPATSAGGASEVLSEPELKKQELLQKVVDKSGIKKKDAKPVVEAMLEVLGEALADGREFNLQPMGKLKLNRTKETPNARIIVAKIRQSKRTGGGGMGPKDTVAAAAE
ncbi:HU family DNA-binding protein [Roseovarius sp. 2305UL8-3]|uniref:HU family DNA-binding protein n=1 Tax=Roseovarius conchicola TaxID=3121636 RepID=UPI003527E348